MHGPLPFFVLSMVRLDSAVDYGLFFGTKPYIMDKEHLGILPTFLKNCV